MTHDHSALLAQLDALKSADVGAVFAELIRSGLQQLIEAEATATIGAGRYERTDGRAVHRNGHRPKTVSTTSGDVEVQIPKPETVDQWFRGIAGLISASLRRLGMVWAWVICWPAPAFPC